MDDDDLEQAIWGELSIGVGYVMCHVTTINCDHNELPQRPSDVMWHAACHVTTVPQLQIIGLHGLSAEHRLTWEDATPELPNRCHVLSRTAVSSARDQET
jgi:hypothetical protein